jgi:TIR domain
VGNIFICYRREDSQFVTDRIFDHLVKVFNRKCLFKDVDNIPPGCDFHSHIKKAIERSAVVLAIIGPSWLSVKNDAGRRRLDDPEDFVYIEISTALHLQRPVLPVLVGGARMPTTDELPPTLRPLARIQAVSVRSDPDFTGDFARLQRALEGIPKVPHRSKLILIFITTTLGTIIAASAVLWYSRDPPVRNPKQIVPEEGTYVLGPLIDKQKAPASPAPASSNGCVDVPFTDTSKFPPVINSKRIC